MRGCCIWCVCALLRFFVGIFLPIFFLLRISCCILILFFFVFLFLWLGWFPGHTFWRSAGSWYRERDFSLSSLHGIILVLALYWLWLSWLLLLGYLGLWIRRTGYMGGKRNWGKHGIIIFVDKARNVSLAEEERPVGSAFWWMDRGKVADSGLLDVYRAPFLVLHGRAHR